MAGERVLVGRPRDRRHAELLSAPLTGGPTERIYSFTAPRGQVAGWLDVAGSAQRVAAVVDVSRDDVDETPVRTFALSGPPSGTLTQIAAGNSFSRTQFAPFAVDVDAGDMLLTEARFSRPFAARYTLLAADGSASQLSLRFLDPRLAGAFAAYASGKTLTVVESRTGAVRYRARFNSGIESFDLDAGGRALAELETGRLVILDPTGARKEVRVRGNLSVRDARLAGDYLVVRRFDRGEAGMHLARLDPTTGRAEQISPSSFEINRFFVPPDVEGDAVAWIAHGCALATTVTGPPSLSIPAGPCPRSEVFLPHAQSPLVRRGRAGIRIRCLSAPPPGCRGVARLERGRMLAEGRILIPPRRIETVRVRFRPGALRALGRRPIVSAVAVTTDTEGRRSSFDASVDLIRPGR